MREFFDLCAEHPIVAVFALVGCTIIINELAGLIRAFRGLP